MSEPIITKTVKPQDCALVFGLPLDKSEFLRELAPESLKDWVKFYQKWNGGIFAEGLWNSFYAPGFVEPALETAELLSTLGGTVYKQCGLTDLPWILTRHSVVTLISHWTSPSVRECLFPAPTDFIDVLRSRRDTTAVALARELDECSFESLGALETHLNALIRTGSLSDREGLQSSETEHPLPEIYRMYLNQAALEDAFPSQFVYGSRLELSDGLASIPAIANAIPEGYHGLLDLSSCNSIVLAGEIKRTHSKCFCIANTQPMTHGIRFVIYRETIKSLYRGDLTYVAAMSQKRIAGGKTVR